MYRDNIEISKTTISHFASFLGMKRVSKEVGKGLDGNCVQFGQMLTPAFELSHEHSWFAFGQLLEL